jgi:3',5'-cyclic-nucleotide phosphodiesterase
VSLDRDVSPPCAVPVADVPSSVHVCRTGKSCVEKVSALNSASIIDLIPILVLIDIPFEDELPRIPSLTKDFRTPSPSSREQTEGFFTEVLEEDLYGLSLLRWVASEMQYQNLSKLIVPVAIVTTPAMVHTSNGHTISFTDTSTFTSDPFAPAGPSTPPATSTPLDQTRTLRYLDLGAVDVLTSPLLLERLPSLAIHAYRAHKDMVKEQKAIMDMKRGRKRSWVGLDDQKPYAYLREAMVSGLMDGICKMEGDEEIPGHAGIVVAANRREKIANAVGSWHFSAHDFTDDELLHAATLMFQHALMMPELEKWRISTGEKASPFLGPGFMRILPVC